MKKTLIFDLDGTLYRGSAPIEAGIRAIRFCQEHDIPYLFLTNNSMRSPKQNAQHMLEMGYENIRPEDFYNSAMAAVRYASQLESGKKAWFIGDEGMKEALEQGGYMITEDHPDFVFVGLSKKAGYADYSRALSLLMQGARLIGTNKDRILAKPEGFEIGNGSIVALFEYAINQKSPDIAKPASPILDFALEKAGTDRKHAVLIGDNLETDIALGYNSGVQTVFVTSGVHTMEDIERTGIVPEQCVSSLDEVDWLRLANAE